MRLLAAFLLGLGLSLGVLALWPPPARVVVVTAHPPVPTTVSREATPEPFTLLPTLVPTAPAWELECSKDYVCGQ